MVQLFTLPKISFRVWFIVCKLGYSRKKMRVEDILLKKPLQFLGLLFHLWKFCSKHSFIPGNPAKSYDTSWEWNQILCDFFFIALKILDLCDFFFIAPENLSYFLFNPRKFYMLFLQYSWKIQVLKQPISWLQLNRQTTDHEILGRTGYLNIFFLE